MFLPQRHSKAATKNQGPSISPAWQRAWLRHPQSHDRKGAARQIGSSRSGSQNLAPFASLLQQLCAVVEKCHVGEPLPSGRGSVGTNSKPEAADHAPLLTWLASPV
jgi:hypothetical protein